MLGYNQLADFDSFKACLPELIGEHRGKFAVVHDREIVKISRSMNAAVRYGAKEFGMEQFIAQEITDEKPRIPSYSMLV